MLTQKHKVRFQQLYNMLSPENLTHDGERTPAEVEAARTAILVEWAQLETRVGRPVSYSEVRNWR